MTDSLCYVKHKEFNRIFHLRTNKTNLLYFLCVVCDLSSVLVCTSYVQKVRSILAQSDEAWGQPVLDSWDRLLSLLPRTANCGTRYVENFFVGTKRFVLHLKEFFVWLLVSLVIFVEPYLTLQMHIFTHYFQRRFTIYYLILIVCSTGFYQDVLNVPSMVKRSCSSTADCFVRWRELGAGIPSFLYPVLNRF